MMKKHIYITTTYIVLFISSEIICGQQFGEDKPNHGKQLNDFNPHHNLKIWNFNKLSSSNEEEDNNKDDVFDDENHGESDSINIESFGSKYNAQNNQFTLYNDPQNKNYLSSLKSVNRDNEHPNKKVTVPKNSFIQNFNAPTFDSDLFNVIDIIYGVNTEKENISFIYVKLRTLEELRDILRKFYNDKGIELKDVLNKHHQINNELSEVFKKYQPQTNEVINEMINLHNPLYNFYNNPPLGNYKLYTSSQKKLVNTLIPALRKAESEIEKGIMSMESTYENLSKIKAVELKDTLEKYANDVMNYNNKILDSIKDPLILNDNKEIQFIQFLIDTLNSEKKTQSIKNKLKFLLNQFKEAKEKYSWHKNVCTIVHIFMAKFIKGGYPYSNNQYFNDLKLIASKRAILIYNEDRLKSLEKLYKYLKEVLFHIFKMLGRILIDNPDPQNNLIFKDEIYEFDIFIHKSKFTSLKNQFFEIFKDEWESYNGKTIDGSDSINHDKILIFENMNKYKNLIDSMENSQRRGLEEKNTFLDEIQKKLDKTTYEERKEGFKSSLELAKAWEKKKEEILTKLNKDNNETAQLGEQIKDSFKKCSDMIAEKKYMKELTLEINEKIKGISDKQEYIKKAIDLEKEVKKNIVYIDELAKQSPYQIKKYVETKDKIYNTIKSKFEQIYVGDINQLYNELSSIVKENAIDNTEDKKKLEALKSKINDEYNKIENMKIQMDASHLNIVEDNKNTLINTILEAKKCIYKDIKNELNKMLDNFKNKKTYLLNNINDYSKHNDELSNYKTTISKIRDQYNEKTNIDNIQEEETREIHEKIKEYMMKISTNEDEILKNINEVKHMKDNFLDKINIYTNFDDIYKENIDSEHNQFSELTKKIETDVLNKELDEYEKILGDNKALILQTTKSIEEEYQNISILNKANEYIKLCENATELIKNFHNKRNELSEILNKNIESIKNTTSIGKSYTDKFLNTLTNKTKKLENIFKDASLNEHEQTNNELKKYFNNLKENLGKDPKSTLSQQFNEKEKLFNDIIQKNVDINKNISNIEIEIYASIHNISDETENEIEENIKSLNTQIFEKVKTNVANLNEIKEKLKQYNFDDFEKEKNKKYNDEINKIKGDITTLDNKIDKNIAKLTEIEKSSESYASEIKIQIDKSEKVTDKTIYKEEPKEIEKKIKNIVTKIDKKKTIYEEINKLLNEISKIETDKTSADEVKDINVSYGTSLSTLFLGKIDEEKKKAENTIKSIETYIENFDIIKKKSNEMQMDIDMEALNISYDEDKYRSINKDNETYFVDIHEKSLKLKNDISGISNISDIKKELQLNVIDAQNHNNEINQYLRKISETYNILKLNSIQNIVDKIKEYTNQIEKNNKNIKNELDKTQITVDALKTEFDLKACESKLDSPIDDKDIDDCINKITDFKKIMLSKEDYLNICYKNSEEHNKIASINFKNIEMTDNQFQHIIEIKSNIDTHNHDSNIGKLNEHKDKSKAYKDEIDNNIKKLEENKKIFEHYKQETTVLLNKYSSLALKNKFDKTKKDSELIIKEIKDIHKNCIVQSETSEQTMNIIKNEQIFIDDSNANNDKSNKAIISIQGSLEKFKTQLLKINNIMKKANDCLKEATGIEEQISKLSINNQDTELINNEIELNDFKKLLSSLKEKKKHIEDQEKELNEVNSQIKNIESDVNQYKKYYEIGIIEKINEIAKANKEKIESTKESIEPIIQNIISSFNADDLEDIGDNEALKTYKANMSNTYNEFMESYDLIKKYSETVSKESTIYDHIKNARIDAQNEFLKNIKNENKAKLYLDDIKINEFDRITIYFINKLNTLSDKFNSEYLKINEGFDNISKYIDNVKNSADEDSLLDARNKIKQEHLNIIRKTYYGYKYEADNIFRNIVKLANSLNIQIQTSSGIDLSKNINAAILSYLNSQKKDSLIFISSPQNISETYTKINNSYNTLLDIFKKSQDLQKKEQQTLNIMFENRRLYETVQATNELKKTLNDLKYKKENILNDVKLVLDKSNELKQLSFGSQNYDTILEPSKYNQIKTKIDNYEQEKEQLGADFDATTMEEKLDNIIKSIEQLENDYNSPEENNNLLQSKKKLNELTKTFNTEIKTIENKIIEKNNLINKLLETRKECLLFTNISLIETLKNKSTNYSKFITSATKFSKEFLKYIYDTSNSLNDDIDALQTKYNLNQTKKHVSSIFADANNDNNDLIETEKNATQAISNLTKLFSIDLQNTDANALYNNKLQMIYFNSEVQKSIERIRQLYKKTRVFKLSNINHINEKYFDTSKLFDNIIKSQKNKLTENLNNLKEIEQYISDQKNNFLYIRKETINPNLNTLKEIYNNIIARESEIYEIENINNNENDNITLYMDTVTKLMEKIQNILDYVTTHENDHNIIGQDIQDNDENDVLKIKNNLKNTIQSFQHIQQKINETTTQFYDNNSINNIITTISKNTNDVKTHISKDLTIESELIHIQYNLADIKNVSYESQSPQVAKYANTIQNYVEEQNKKIENNPNIDEIENTIEKIKNYNKESEIKLQHILNHQKHVTSITTDIIKILTLIKSEYNNNIPYKDAIKHEKDSNNLIYDLNNSQSILNNLIYKNKNIIKHLEYKKQNIQNSINSYTINIQETAEIKHHSNTHHDDINDIKYTNQGYPNSDQNNSLETRSILNYIKYAGAVAFGFVAVYIIGKFRKKDETNKIYIDKSENIYYTKKSKYQRRDEFIEINMNKD
ncbi:reticulocyte binding protein, putative [Plasmodium berghei]|uniref:Reticulocyte binding protein, putative n=2 Tax=Plasmodium berghei TaxID=5821 RepID=A0A509AEL1_PLABA|nr:reticulocyte binding protein, putative [Plasmodium berghei ANKA]CXH97376.1 reticulocyte binding protein, putative [Plasmodium berghei]SBW38102.1 reticulocyte binding protein, putative [Plasmodium berghei]SCL81398.1 reticulocyte binding protein, putative [Plasmodium berghei]SCL81604.1 reticulocyte binding protein, putative [Plasmodium berghei]SCM15461.1 reticulocyte binding protein, putative [Plasmodium berghei]|eukprot:XP_034420046.1 reticulocyte binding protein, putative [Plasmodium berghei ANKA]